MAKTLHFFKFIMYVGMYCEGFVLLFGTGIVVIGVECPTFSAIVLRSQGACVAIMCNFRFLSPLFLLPFADINLR